MSYQIVLKGGVTGTTKSATFVTSGGDQIVLAGTGFKYDAAGYLKSGTITSMTFMDTDFGTPVKAQTVTMKNVSAADLYHDVLSPALGLIKKTGDWSTTDDMTSFSSKKIVFEMDDFSQVVIRGTGFTDDLMKGKVTSLEHLDLNGHHLETISSLNVSLSLALTALGDSSDIYNYLVKGDNKITNFSAFPPTLEGGLGNDTLDGGSAAFATADYRHSAIAGINADLETGKVTGGAGTDQLINIRSLQGSSFNDVISGKDTKPGTFGDSLSGNGGNDKIDGRGGNDYLSGGNGNDTLLGGAGDDNLNGGAGNDKIDGGAGLDVVNFGGETLDPKGITISLSATAAQDFGGWGKDILLNVEGVYGSDVADHISGSKVANVLIGGGGSDVIKGYGGNDTLYAQIGPGGSYTNTIGNDTLDGGSGDDVIYCGDGVDLMIGGEGKDTFVFVGEPRTYFSDVDKIKDFTSKDDTIKLYSSSFDRLDPGKLAASHFFLGTSAKDSGDWLIYDKHTGNLYYDEDGKGGNDQHLIATLLNKGDLTSADFLIL